MHKFGDLLTEKQLPQMKNKIYGGLNETEMTPFQGDQQDVPASGQKEKGNLFR